MKPTFRAVIYLLIAVAAVLSVAALLVLRPDGRDRTAAGQPASQYDTVPLRMPSQEFSLLLAATPEQQELGLGERDSLAPGQGMLFPYDSAETRCFWMKGMRFPIDIIWLDDTKKVTGINANVSPDSYPETFCSEQPARYVIELNANAAQKSGITTGMQLTF